MTQGLFIAGRQHSGNTMLCQIFLNHPQCFCDCNENTWFEWRPIIEGTQEPETKVHSSVSHLLAGREEDAQRIEPQLLDWFLANPSASVYELFSQGMRRVTDLDGKDFWVLKATSYIFYAEEILQNLPAVKIVYLMRNPMDLIASTYNRIKHASRQGEAVHYGDWLYTVVIGWRKGVELALRLQQVYPDRFLILKYEDLVSESQRSITEVFHSLGLSYDNSVLDVPHINPSDHPYRDSKRPRGLNTTRIYYYPTVLDLSEMHAAWSVMPMHLLGKTYPDLPEPPAIPFIDKGKAQWHKAVCVAHLFRRHAKEVIRQPNYGLRRIWQRVRA